MSTLILTLILTPIFGVLAAWVVGFIASITAAKFALQDRDSAAGKALAIGFLGSLAVGITTFVLTIKAVVALVTALT